MQYKSVDRTKPDARWALFYLASFIVAMAGTWVFVSFVLSGKILTYSQPIEFIPADIKGLLVLSTYVLIACPLTFVVFLLLGFTRKWAFGFRVQFWRVFLVASISFALQFFGIQQLDYSPRSFEFVFQYGAASIVAAFIFSALIWATYKAITSVSRQNRT